MFREREALGRRAEVEKLSDAAIAAEMVIGWKGVADGAGAPVPFSEAALRRALDTPNVAAAVVSTFFESNARASSKNSRASSNRRASSDRIATARCAP